MAGTKIGTVAELWCYPVKSMQGESVDAVTVTAAGIEGDRRLAVRDVTTGKVASAKLPRKWAGLLQCRATTGDDGSVSVHVPGHGDHDAASTGLAAVLGEFLGTEVTLDAADGAESTYESYWPQIDDVALSDVEVDLPVAMMTARSSFVDLAALHLVASSTVDHVRTLVPGANVGIARFRPSLVVDTTARSTATAAEDFVEDGWVGANLQFGGVTVEVTNPSPRCVMTTVAQPAMARAPEVLQAIARHHRREFAGAGAFACLGVYAEVVVPGTVRVGDTVTLA